MLLASTNCVGAVWWECIIILAPLLFFWNRIRYEREGRFRAINVILHRGCAAETDRSDNFSIHLDGKPAAPRGHARECGDTGQKRRVALDKFEKFLRRNAEQSRVRLVLRHLNAEDRCSIHPAKGLKIAPVIDDRHVLGNAK